ncbi:MAG TPA: DJ-1/PfpI family protein [Actinophytocola sp.]|uniref:DJ-1/PfpI family protein n=1 Tax=Actinophytocola sp. TaxID=1872138 RepID=UPI002DBD9030|nr:DJ-1/PfpI family protein [Actinophytocola sp.]HEU5472454.1 DJ-1/PfpI family protein [Actinophytocola sp.]
MQVAIPLYDRITALDAVGPYQVLGMLPGIRIVHVGARTGTVRTELGSLGLVVDATFDEVGAPDIVLVPGGPGAREHLSGGPLMDWLRAVDPGTTWTTSVCTGSLVLAAAGLLTGRRATTHWSSRNLLTELGATAVTERVVFDGKYVTAAGVSSGIDMALSLAGRIAGEPAARAVQLGIEYDPQPPFDSGALEKASDEVVQTLRDLVAARRDAVRS